MSEAEDFLEAARRGDEGSIRAALAGDAALVHARGENARTALHWAAENDDLELATLLMEAGADLEAETDWGATPLDWAAANGNGPVAALLLRRGASGLDFVNAASLGRGDIVKSFLDQTRDTREPRPLPSRRAAPAASDGDHWPGDCAHLQGDVVSDAFYAACRNGHVAVAQLLLENGAAIDARGVFGGTALHWAAYNGHRETVTWLLANGANPAVVDTKYSGDCAGWADEGGHPRLAELLRAIASGRR